MGEGAAADEAVQSFCSITGATADQAKFFLESTAGDVDAAISSFFDHAEGGGGGGGGGGGEESEGAGGGGGIGGGGGGGAAAPAATTHGAALGGGIGGDEEMGDEVQQQVNVNVELSPEQMEALGPAMGQAMGALFGALGGLGAAGLGATAAAANLAGVAAGAGAAGLGGGGGVSGGGPVPGGRGRRGGGGGGGTGKVRTLGDLGKEDMDEDDDDDDDGPQEYYTGGEKSGMMVQDPNRRRGGGGSGGAFNADDFFERARELGARVGTSDEEAAARTAAAGRGVPQLLSGSRGGGAFAGVGRTLGTAASAGAAPNEGGAGAAAVGAGAAVAPPPAAAPAVPPRHAIHLYRNGFTVDNGPLRDFADPANAAFLSSLGRGECPAELMKLHPSSEVEVDLVRSSGDYTPPPQPAYVAFQGTGRTLGSTLTEPQPPAPLPSTSDTSTAAAAAVALAPSAMPTSAPPPVKGLVVDDAAPVTSIQLRLADGTRIVARFNHTHTVGDIRRFIDASRPGGGRRYALQSPGFPPKKLDDDDETIEQAGLINSVVIQR